MTEIRFPWETEPAPVRTSLPETEPPPKKARGRRPTATILGRRHPSQTAAGGWLYHWLTVSGPADRAVLFAEAARGPGIVPWRVDGARIEEDIFNLAASQPKAIRALTIEGCRILARQFRERVEDRAARAAALVGRSRACPFDLHSLLPVPATILGLGPTHPDARAWLSENWGITDSPRQVMERSHPTALRRLPAGHSVVGYGFFTTGETPRVAIARVAADWPDLRFALQPRPAD